MKSKPSLLLAGAMVSIFVGLSISTVDASQPSLVLGQCFPVAEFTFAEAVADLTATCEAANPGADRLLVTMCFPSGPPAAGGPQADCPVCDLSTEWALSCSVLSRGAP